MEKKGKQKQDERNNEKIKKQTNKFKKGQYKQLKGENKKNGKEKIKKK